MSYTPDNNRYSNGMIYRKCGNSGISLPAISLGLWHNFGEVDNYHNGLEIVKFAFDNGITHFDLANNYGPPPGSAESNFGKMLKNEFSAHRDEMIISTKAGHVMWPGPYGDGGSRKSIVASIDQSLKRLGLDYVDIFYSHRYDPNTPLEETLDALIDIVKHGKALYIGLSKYPAAILSQALQYLQDNKTRCLIYQDRYSLLNRNLEKNHFDTIAEHSPGIITFSPLAQGILTDKYLNGIPEHSRAANPDGYLKESDITKAIIEKVQQLQPLACDRGQTIAELSISWILRNKNITSVIAGCSSVKQLKTNLNAVSNIHFTDDELDVIHSLFPI